MICTCCHVYYTKASCFYTYILKVFIVRGTYVWAGCDSDVNMSDCDSVRCKYVSCLMVRWCAKNSWQSLQSIINVMMLSLVRKVCIESDNDAIFVLVSCLHIINKVTAEGLNLIF